MIQPVLFFALGFLCAGFLSLMIAPALWQRAVTLTRRRIEATVPLTLNEIQADKDRLRAEFAMSTRRLEMSVKEFKDRATTQILEINRNRDELRRLADERDQAHRSVSDLEMQSSELRGELRRREDELARASGKLDEVSKALQSRQQEVQRLGSLYDQTTFESSSRQIELVARESEMEKLSGDVSELRAARKEAERRAREAAAESKAFQETMQIEKRRAADLDKKLERLISTIADRDEKLDMRERELTRLREAAKAATQTEQELQAQLVLQQKERVLLEGQIADLTGQTAKLLESARGAEFEKVAATLAAEREKLEARIGPLETENRRLKVELAARVRAQSDDWSDEKQVSALLREQMNDLAAEVLNLTAMLDGPASPIARALDVARPDVAGSVVSLADRVRALQKAAAGA
ncbi:MAG: hypothetical protein JNL61_10645 [Rhizobiaceae bacterium]|nr:hypothetical protein [Rhizobiaceae bacterium]